MFVAAVKPFILIVAPAADDVMVPLLTNLAVSRVTDGEFVFTVTPPATVMALVGSSVTVDALTLPVAPASNVIEELKLTCQSVITLITELPPPVALTVCGVPLKVTVPCKTLRSSPNAILTPGVGLVMDPLRTKLAPPKVTVDPIRV